MNYLTHLLVKNDFDLPVTLTAADYRLQYHGRLWIFLFILLFFPKNNFANDPKSTPNYDGPVEVAVSLDINKIYDISTIHQHYRMDGYLVLSWMDSRLAADKDTLTMDKMYENDNVIELINRDIWFPTFEFMNNLEKEEVQNKSLIIRPNGQVIYNERFNGLFYADMNFRKFPFDNQSFSLFLESFSYDTTEVKFVNLKIFPLIENSQPILMKWRVSSLDTKITEKSYDHLSAVDEGHSVFSRATFSISCTRLSGYYVWQVLLPLILIIVASWVVFWLENVGNQLGISFTLMLTVVAFNFYSATILPKLPYNTFIETVIIIGYIFIFLTIVAVVVHHRLSEIKKPGALKLEKRLRWIFPLCYLTTMILTYVSFFGI